MKFYFTFRALTALQIRLKNDLSFDGPVQFLGNLSGLSSISLYYVESKKVYCKCPSIKFKKLNKTDDKQVCSDRAWRDSISKWNAFQGTVNKM